MKGKLDTNTLLIYSSYIYLSLPLIIFFLFWFNYCYSFFFTFIILLGLFLSLKIYKHDSKNSLYTNDNIKITIMSILTLLIWIYFSGIGSFSYQNYDYNKHNALLRDLINYSWPVHYKLPKGSGLLIYYIGYYLPSALVGKIMGWKVANFFIFIWSFIGLIISYLWATKYIKDNSIRTLSLFIFFSGADIIGKIFDKKDILINGIHHIDRWFMISYQSNTTLLFWVPQHVLVAWICVGLLLNDFYEDINKNYCFILCLSLFWSPFVFLGLFPFVAILILIKKKKFLSFQNIVIAPIIILIIAGFYVTNKGNTSVSGFIWEFIDIIDKWYLLLAFFLCEFMMHIVLMKDYINRLDKNSKSIIYTAIIFLSFLPIYVIGEYNDLAMRASIPSLFIIMIFIGRYINESKHKDYRYYIIIFLLFMGSFTGILEISRAAIGVYEKQTICDYWYSLVNIEKKFTSQYIDEDVEGNFYYSYLLKKNRPEGDIVYNLDDLIWNRWNEDSSKIEYDLEKLTIKSEEPVDTSFTCQIKLSEGVYLVYINVSGYINKIDQSGAHLSFHGVTKIIDIQPGKYNNAELKKIVKIDEDGYDGMIDFGIGGWGKSSGNIQLNDIIIMKLD